VSAEVNVSPLPATPGGMNWPLRLRQIGGILRLEVRKNFVGKRALPMYLLASVPVLLMSLLAFADEAMQRDVRINFAKANEIFSNIHEGLILRTVIFFGCAWIFMNLFRGEVVDKSLHYYFLSAVRREVLVAGKYLAGLIAAVFLFLYTTAGTLFFLYWPRGVEASLAYLFDGPGLKHVLTYLGVTVLACVGYGALFMVIGLFFRNPIIPALVVYGWEWINFLLPPLLKKISVIHYLHSLVPVPVDEGPFAVVGEPTPAWLTIPGLLIFTAAVLAVASVRIRRMEIRYGGE
jgi:ABC-type transport system involved in multi-copper enzyme maturation permease subunit